MTKTQKNKARTRATVIAERDKKLEKKKTSLNAYESLIYSTRDFIQDESMEVYLKSDNEKERLLLFIEKEEEWLLREGTSASYDTLKNKIKVLENKIKPIRKRKEYRDILFQEIDSTKQKITETETSFKRYILKKEWIPDGEKAKFEKIAEEMKVSLDEKYKRLEETPLNEKPPFKESDIQKDLKQVTDKLKDIKKIKKPKEPKKEVISNGDLMEAPEQDEIDVTEEELINGKMTPEMREQVDRLLKKDKLKQDIVDGKINVEELTDQELADIGL
jgi:hypothetical protein